MDSNPRHAEIPRTGTIDFKPAASEKTVPDHFRQSPHSFKYETELERASGPVRILHVRFPSPLETEVPENNTVHAKYFQPPGEGPTL